MNKYYVTKERLTELEEELRLLKTGKRQEVAQRLKTAKEFGDLSENSEYAAAKEEQEWVERRIFELEEILKQASVIRKPAGSETVGLGSTVTLRLQDEVVTYKIVGSDETKPEEGKISNESPLGSRVMGRKVGDSVTLSTPGGAKVYRITKVE